jgi:hypothetical protein
LAVSSQIKIQNREDGDHMCARIFRHDVL